MPKRFFKNRYAKICVELLSLLLLGVMLAGGWLIWRLGQGPIEWDYLTPRLEQALSASSDDITAHVSHTVITWQPDNYAVRIEAVDIEFYDLTSPQEPFITVSKAEVGLSLSSLIFGQIKPTRVAFYQPMLQLIRDEKNHLLLALSHNRQQERDRAEKAEVLDMEELEAPDLSVPIDLVGPPQPAPENKAKEALNKAKEYVSTDQESILGRFKRKLRDGGPLSELEEISIHTARLSIDDWQMQRMWIVPSLDIRLEVSDDDMVGEASFSTLIREELARFNAKLFVDLVDEAAELNFTFDDLNFADLVQLSPHLKGLREVNLPVSGNIQMQVVNETLLDLVSINLTTTGGLLHYPLPGFAPIKLAEGQLSGTYDTAGKKLLVDQLNLKFDDLNSSSGPILRGQVVADLESEQDGVLGTNVRVYATVLNMPIQSLKYYWPPSIGYKPRSWIVPNIQAGQITEANLTMAGFVTAGPKRKFTLDTMDGKLAFEDGIVDYFYPMQPATDVEGTARFDKKQFDIDLEGGRVNNLILDHADLLIPDLWAAVPALNIDLDAAGKLETVLQLLNSPNFQYLDKIGLKANQLQGDADIKLQLGFPLLKDLKVDEVDVAAQGVLENASYAGVFKSLDLTDGVFRVAVDKTGLDLEGTGRLGATDKNIKWHEDFAGADIQRTLNVSGRVATSELTRFGLPLEDYARGSLDLAAIIQQYRGKKAGQTDITLQGNLADVQLSIPQLDWQKPVGEKGKASISLGFDKDGLQRLNPSSISAGSLKISGQGSFQPQTTSVRSFEVSELSLPGTQIRIDGKRQNNMLDMRVSGERLNLAGFVDYTPAEEKADNKQEAGTPKRIQIDIAELTLQQESPPLRQVRGSLSNDGDVWSSADINGRVADGSWQLKLQPQQGGRNVSLTSDQAGGFLTAVGGFGQIQGGSLNATGRFDDTNPLHPLQLSVEMRDFRVIKAPILTRILSIGSLTGILDVLQGEGIQFKRLNAEALVLDQEVQLQSLRAAGDPMALELEGTVNLASDQLKMKGTVVPANSLNSTLNKIPIIGTLLTGTKGEGIFAGRFTVEGDTEDPSVTVNPITSLAPGIVRDFLELLGGE